MLYRPEAGRWYCAKDKRGPDHEREWRKSAKQQICQCETQGREEKVLLPKIIASERRNMPRLCTQIRLEGIPCCMKPPFRLLSLTQSGVQPRWRPLEDSGCYQRARIIVCIPVCAKIQDSCGECCNAEGSLETEVTLSFEMAHCNGWKQQLFINPCIRLLGADCSENHCFPVEVDVKLEIYLLKPEPCTVKKHRPACQEKPLYPQPCRDDCMTHPPFRPWNG